MKAASALLLERGHEAPKLGAAEASAPRVKAPARGHQRRQAANGTEFNPGHRPIVELGATDELPMAPMEPRGPIVSAQFFDYMTRIATAAMGPMAHLVLRDQIAALGESQDAFPQIKLRQLIGLISQEILNETMRERFQHMMFQEIDPL